MSRVIPVRRLSEGEAKLKRAAMDRQYRIKPARATKNNTMLRHKDQQDWLRTRGKIPARDLTSDERDEVRECFHLLDTDGTGAIEFDELLLAFRVLNVPMSQRAILALFKRYSGDGDAVDLKAFEKIIAASHVETSSTGQDDDYRAKEDKNAEDSVLDGETGGVRLPFKQVASAFRRKKLLGLFMAGGKSRQEILDAKDLEKRTQASNLFSLPTLRSRMMTNSEEKVVSRYFMLDKLEEIGEDTWKGKRGILPSQAIHSALDRGHTWEHAERQVSNALQEKKKKTPRLSGGQMSMYKMSAKDRQYAQSIRGSKGVERWGEGLGRREESLDNELSPGKDSSDGGVMFSPSLIPKLPELREDPSLGQVSATSSRSRRSAGNGFVLDKRSKVPGSLSRIEVELAKSRKTKAIERERMRSARRRMEGQLKGAITRVPADVLHNLAQPNGRSPSPSDVWRPANWNGGIGNGESSMVATVAQDRAQFGHLAGASSHQRPDML